AGSFLRQPRIRKTGTAEVACLEKPLYGAFLYLFFCHRGSPPATEACSVEKLLRMGLEPIFFLWAFACGAQKGVAMPSKQKPLNELIDTVVASLGGSIGGLEY